MDHGQTGPVQHHGADTYIIGGAADAWGRSWTTASLGTGSFRVRITDVSSTTGRRFDPDYLGVAVNYAP